MTDATTPHLIYTYTHAHPTIPVVMVRADHGTYPGVSGVNVGIDLTPAEARRMAADLIVSADEIEARLAHDTEVSAA